MMTGLLFRRKGKVRVVVGSEREGDVICEDGGAGMEGSLIYGWKCLV